MGGAQGIGHLAKGPVSPAKSDTSGIDGAGIRYEDFHFDSQDEYGDRVPKVVDDAGGISTGAASRSPSFGNESAFSGVCGETAGSGAGPSASSSSASSACCNALADKRGKVTQRVGAGGASGTGFRTAAQLAAPRAKEEARQARPQREREERDSQAPEYLRGCSSGLDDSDRARPSNEC